MVADNSCHRLSSAKSATISYGNLVIFTNFINGSQGVKESAASQSVMAALMMKSSRTDGRMDGRKEVRNVTY